MHHRFPLLLAAFLLAIGGPAAPLAAPSPDPATGRPWTFW